MKSHTNLTSGVPEIQPPDETSPTPAESVLDEEEYQVSLHLRVQATSSCTPQTPEKRRRVGSRDDDGDAVFLREMASWIIDIPRGRREKEVSEFG